jgi:hypothetical protein
MAFRCEQDTVSLFARLHLCPNHSRRKNAICSTRRPSTGQPFFSRLSCFIQPLSHVTSILGPLVARSFASQLHLLPPPPRLTSSAACHAVVSSDLFHDSGSIRIFFGDCRVLFFSLVPVFTPAPNEYHATMTDNALHCSSVKRGDEPNLSHLHIKGLQN